MVNKKQIHWDVKQIQHVKTWRLIVVFILMFFISATLLRLNNIGMVERRAAVLSAEKIGDNKITTNRLYDLQRYVSAHMNTDMGKGIYLEEMYKKDVEAVYVKASNDSNLYGNIYKKAQAVCQPQFSYWSYAYLECTTVELAKYPSSEELVSDLKLPSADSYLHVFISPVWSPDFAGWSVVICLIILIIIIARLVSVVILKLLLHSHSRGI